MDRFPLSDGTLFIDDHHAPVWNEAVNQAIDAVTAAAEDDSGADSPYDNGAGRCGYSLACRRIEEALRKLIRPELSAAEIGASVESMRAMMQAAVEKHAARSRAVDALRPFVAAYQKAADPIGDSDLYDEQPRGVSVTLGNCRSAERALRHYDSLDAEEPTP